MGALFDKTAKLPRVELVRKDSVIGRNTVSSLQAGAFFGYAGAVLNIVNTMKQELGGSAQVIATGGLASLLAAETGVFKCVDRTLTLDGLYIIYQQYLRGSRP